MANHLRYFTAVKYLIRPNDIVACVIFRALTPHKVRSVTRHRVHGPHKYFYGTRLVKISEIGNVMIVYIANHVYHFAQQHIDRFIYPSRSIMCAGVVTSSTSSSFSFAMENDILTGLVKNTLAGLAATASGMLYALCVKH